MRYRNGNLSIFSALSILIVASVLFVYLECARVNEMEKITQMVTDSALESVFAGYDRLLWDHYQILARSAGAIESDLTFDPICRELEEVIEADVNPTDKGMFSASSNFFRAECSNVNIKSYTLLTDGNGQAFQNLVCSYMKRNLSVEIAKEIKDQYDKSGQIEDIDLDAAVENAQKGIQEAKSNQGSEQKSDGKEEKISQEPQQSVETQNNIKIRENPLELVTELRKKDFFSLLIGEDKELSKSQIEIKNAVSHRKIAKGTGGVTNENGWYENILLNQYYVKKFSDFSNPRQDGALQYEREYLICGKKDDISNLKGCVSKVMWIREGTNLCYLLQDAGKQAEAMSVATLLAGATANPAIIEAVKYGILAAWAYVESILDLRALLQGDKIALIKNAQQWTSDLHGMGKAVSQNGKANHCENGMTYSDYINIILSSCGASKTAYRAMDLMELFLQKQQGYDNFRIDHMITELSIETEYEYQNVFLSLVTLGNYSDMTFLQAAKANYSYSQSSN